MEFYRCPISCKKRANFRSLGKIYILFQKNIACLRFHRPALSAPPTQKTRIRFDQQPIPRRHVPRYALSILHLIGSNSHSAATARPLPPSRQFARFRASIPFREKITTISAIFFSPDPRRSFAANADESLLRLIFSRLAVPSVLPCGGHAFHRRFTNELFSYFSFFDSFFALLRSNFLSPNVSKVSF